MLQIILGTLVTVISAVLLVVNLQQTPFDRHAAYISPDPMWDARKTTVVAIVFAALFVAGIFLFKEHHDEQR